MPWLGGDCGVDRNHDVTAHTGIADRRPQPAICRLAAEAPRRGRDLRPPGRVESRMLAATPAPPRPDGHLGQVTLYMRSPFVAAFDNRETNRDIVLQWRVVNVRLGAAAPCLRWRRTGARMD